MSAGLLQLIVGVTCPTVNVALPLRRLPPEVSVAVTVYELAGVVAATANEQPTRLPELSVLLLQAVEVALKVMETDLLLLNPEPVTVTVTA